MHAFHLRWEEVAPATNEFELARIEPAVRAAVADAWPGKNRNLLVARVERAVTETYGRWAQLWNWSSNNGGPVAHFCCPSHSIFPKAEREPGPTADRILRAIGDWRWFLEELAAIYDAVLAEGRGESPAMLIERAAPRLLELVLRRTGAEDAWHATMHASLAWFAEVVLFDPTQAHDLVSAAIDGRFESWIQPPDDVVREAFSALALGVTEPVDAIDGTAAWWAIRATAFHRRPPTRRREDIVDDGHARYIELIDTLRERERGERMTAALVLCRDAAAHQLPLAFDQLAEWQAIVLGAGAPVPLRTTDAFAKRGRERYPADDGLAARVEAALAEANDRRVQVAVRAARVYLDICFLHPFSDGNARSARLALDHVLAREGLVLADARPVFSLSRHPGDASGASCLAHAIDRLAGPRA